MSEEINNKEVIKEIDETDEVVYVKKKSILERKITIKSTLIIILVLVLLVCSFFGGFAVAKKMYDKPEKIGKGILLEHIKKCQDLITARGDAEGRIHYSKGKIPVISKNSFNMEYVAHYLAGIDLKEVDIDIKGKNIIVKTPHAVIKDLYIDGESLQFSDDQGSILSHRRHEHVPEAITDAKEDAEAKVNKKKTLQKADKQIKKVFKELLDFAKKKKYKIEVQFIE